MMNAKQMEKECSKQANELESQLKDASNTREKQLAETEHQLKVLRKKAETSRKEWLKHQQESNTLEIEINELRNTIEKGKKHLSKEEEQFNNLKTNVDDLKEELNQAKSIVDNLQEKLNQQRESINSHNKEMQTLASQKEDIIKQNLEIELEIKKLDHKINSIRTNAKESEHKLAELSKKHEWIKQDEAYFGKSGKSINYFFL